MTPKEKLSEAIYKAVIDFTKETGSYVSEIELPLINKYDPGDVHRKYEYGYMNFVIK